VQRLTSPHWRKYPSAATFERVAASARGGPARLARRALMAHDLREVGITVDCLPVLDAPQPGSHDIIGDRAYSRDPANVARLAEPPPRGCSRAAFCRSSSIFLGMDAPAPTAIWSCGGRGLARGAGARRFSAFKANADLPLAMTAHVVYTALDPAGRARCRRP